MGAATFAVYGTGSDPEAVFWRLVDQALIENGHGGYTGTIAEKTEYIVLTDQALPYPDATATARALINDHDPRINDSRGPAGAIAVTQMTPRSMTADGVADALLPEGWLFFGYAPW
ncbi:hypothetical protein [Winogradskya humida]|uniref:Uncharacterized protein n=1 Tax=Winogradskya humida TaxID=113566 RepID=A0ABQ4A1V3_9ACTN|nr:hypothetical protein [Actinoplanes humidus]GIE24835.1 hypothetical protein Ahu01nite_079370 [Actinoplanes humidus]